LAVVLLTTPASARGDDLTTLLGRHGLRAVNPPTPAAGFELPSLAGDKIALADARGRWVLLTFFATWCGPCRSEMPSLERLHNATSGQGVDLLAVAIDGTRHSVRRFVDSVGVTFPVLLDDGEVAGRYQAFSVPVSYLIDPSGRVVAMARGARDWGAMTGLVDGLLRADPADPADPAPQGAFAERLDLPPTLVPPTAEVTTSTEEPRPGEPFTVDVRITWDGQLRDYLLHPPVVHLPDAVSTSATSATTTSADGGAVVTYHIELLAGEPGAFALDPVELRYTPRGEKEQVATRLAGPTVRVAASTWSQAVWLTAALLLLGGLSTAALLWRRARKKAVVPPAARDELTELFDEARRSRVNGDTAAFLEAARRLAVELGIGDELALDDALERTRYGGQPPASEQLDQWQRLLRRHLASRTAEGSASDGIRLANSNGEQKT
jgi:peroxiredoxin